MWKLSDLRITSPREMVSLYEALARSEVPPMCRVAMTLAKQPDAGARYVRGVRVGQTDGSTHGSRMTGATRLQTEPCHATGTGWLSWSTQRVPTPSHRGAVVHVERVQRDRVGPFIAGHERVANEGEYSTVKSIPNSALWRTMQGGPVHWALKLDGARCPGRAGPQGLG